VKPFVVAGAGRSGTLYISKVLSELGVPCTHEKHFQPSTRQWPEDFSGGEASWHAVPFLEHRPRDVAVVHQVRHPVDVVGSLYGREFFRHSASTLQWLATWRKLVRGSKIAAGRRDCIRFIDRTIPWILEPGDEITRCIRYWIAMNEISEHAGESPDASYLRVRIEDLGPESIGQILSAANAEPRSTAEIQDAIFRAKASSHKSTAVQNERREALAPSALPANPEWRSAQLLADRYGYERRC
jgi:hypothetical protein